MEIAARLGIGVRSVETLVRRVLRKLGVRRGDLAPAGRGRGSDGLPARENAVLQLVRRGMTDAEVAAQLQISRSDG